LAQHRRKPTYRIQPTKGWAGINVGEIWRYRDLLWVLVQRDLKLLYEQTALGAIWIVAQPLVAAVILGVVFGRVAKLPSDGPHWKIPSDLRWKLIMPSQNHCGTYGSDFLYGRAMVCVCSQLTTPTMRNFIPGARRATTRPVVKFRGIF